MWIYMGYAQRQHACYGAVEFFPYNSKAEVIGLSWVANLSSYFHLFTLIDTGTYRCKTKNLSVGGELSRQCS